MIELSEFLLKSSIVLLVFYLGYWFLLRKGTHFRLNRLYLLMGVLFSLLIPFFSFQLPGNNTSEIFVTLDSIDIVAGNQLAAEKTHGFADIIQLFYYLIAIVFFARVVMQLYMLLKLFTQSEIETVEGTKVVITNKKNAVFSFFKLVYANKSCRYSADFHAIIKHEQVHIVQKHSVDILLAELLSIILWFNPFAWLYKKSIKENHEYLADQVVVNNGYSANHYQKLLFEQSTGLHLSLANNFNKSLTFKRLNMMKKIKSNKLAKYKVLIAVPVIIAIVVFVSCSKELVNIEPVKNEDGIDLGLRKKTMAISEKDTVFFVVENMPQFPGGEEGLRNYIAQNVKYPEYARVNGIEGKIYVRFVVTKTGDVDHVTIARGVDSILDNEALRVVKTLPKWMPAEQSGKKVNVWYTVPINFSLSEKVVVTDEKRNTAGIKDNRKMNLIIPIKDALEINGVSNKKVSNMVKQMPDYPGGELGLRKFLASNVKYPEGARKNKISGKVFVKFRIKNDGTVDKVSIIRGNNPDLNKEAMRVVKLTSGKWIPGEQKGNKVNIWYTVPINFQLK
ncbi:MAG: hypothetical protein B6I20_01835 [Bacteroidetes bacterium 4572_117]|nr:MAG: hypothetical protein B6I20_01835 [Bacteroidetes bacterium 4572_117]